jgi:hypothetical protein
VPLSLLLTQHFTVLTDGVRKLSRWESLTDTFALVARRLRSAFLVQWFGTALPVAGLDLAVTIANLDELQARWAMVTRGRRDDAGFPGPNLTEPLLGASGMLAGALAFPLNGMVAAVILGSVMRRWWQKLFAGLIWISGGGLLTGLLLLGGPLFALGLIPYAISGQAGDLYGVLGGLAALALPLHRLWAQLSGREPIRNPLLRQLAVLADRLAALIVQVLGAVAVAVTRIAPQLAPAVDAARATRHAVGQILEAVTLVALSALDALGQLLRGPASLPAIARGVVTALLGLVSRLGRMIAATLSRMLDGVMSRFGPALSTVARFMIGAAGFVRQVIVDNPTVRWLLSLVGIVRAVRTWYAGRSPAAGKPKSKPSPWLTSFPVPPSGSELARVLHTTPSVPGLAVSAPPLVGPDLIPPIADAMRKGLLAAPADPFALTPPQRAALERFRRPPSVFGGIRADLLRRRQEADAAGGLFTLADVLAGITPYLTRSAESLMPQQAQSFLPKLGDLLDRIDLELHGKARPHPTKDLPEPAAVRPVIGRLLVRTDAGSQAGPSIREFVSMLRRDLDTRTYVVPAGAGSDRRGAR